MFVLNEDFDTPPPDETTVWRYMGLDRFLALLSSRKLYLRRLDAFRDPWEGTFPRIMEAILDGQLSRIGFTDHEVDIQREQRKTLRRNFYVNCWHMNAYESAALWDQYAGYAGVAIRSSVSRLKNLDRDNFGYFLGRVEYVDYNRFECHVGRFREHRITLMKRKSFEHEQELRLVVGKHPILDSDLSPEGMYLLADLRILIESVWISAESSTLQIEHVKDLLERFDLCDLPVEKSGLYEKVLR